jgi:hypothetical protein
VNKQNHKGGDNKWGLREKILMCFGLGLIALEEVNAEILSGTFHYEFLIAGLALCGISIAQWGDKR